MLSDFSQNFGSIAPLGHALGPTAMSYGPRRIYNPPKICLADPPMTDIPFAYLSVSSENVVFLKRKGPVPVV